MAKKQDKKQCFVVGPIGDDHSDDRIHADWLLEGIIQPVFEEHFKEFEVMRADKISDPGRIDAQVITALLDADLVIADLTTLNPNAFYEIGIRHTVQKPIIHMHLEGQRIPFDITTYRSIKFSRARPSDLQAAKRQLKAAVDSAIAEDHEVDNPVSYARAKVEFEKTATPKEKLVQEQLETLQARVHELEKDKRHNAIVEALQRKVIRDAEAGQPRNRTRRIKLIVEDVSSLGNAALQNIVESHANSLLQSYAVTAVSDENGNLSFEVSADYVSDFDRASVKAFIDQMSTEGCSVTI